MHILIGMFIHACVLQACMYACMCVDLLQSILSCCVHSFQGKDVGWLVLRTVGVVQLEWMEPHVHTNVAMEGGDLEKNTWAQ